jgi:hypothetical protein
VTVGVTRARYRRSVASAIIVVALAAFVGLQLYLHAFDRPPWQVVPSQISACGRDYVNPARSQPQGLETATRAAGATLEKVTSTPGWVRTREIWGHRDAANPGDLCGTLVWLRADSSHFIEYALSGGP